MRPPPEPPGPAASGLAGTADQPPALGEALALVADRWKLTIVDALLDGPRRFGELSDAIAVIAPNILAQRLRHLEETGVVLAVPYSDRPVRFLYELTAAGHDLAGVLRLLADWGARHAGGEPLRHAACGAPLEARWYCPTCDQPADDAGSLDQLFYA